MGVLAVGVTAAVTLVAALIRFGGASLVRTPRADALHDAADEVPGAARVAALLEDRAAIQPALGVVHAALLVVAAISASWAITTGVSGPGLAGALVGLGVVLVLVGDTIPRSLGRNRPRFPAYRFSRLLERSVRFGERAADMIVEYDDEETEEERSDPVDDEEILLISSVLEFTDAIVREVMVPRTDMLTIAASADTNDALERVIESGISRVPVTGDDLDDVVGVLYARDLLTLARSGEGPVPVTKMMRTATFVPETKKVSELFRELQSEGIHLAIAVDEFGGTAGLVTMEDLIEEIVGEIVDEYDIEEPMVEAVSEGVFLVDARLSVDDLSQLIGRTLPDEDWDTVGGLVLGLAGRVPVEGESFELDSVIMTAERVQGRRVSRVRVTAS
jgi:CBS domain containing-hemolysin-like protein